MFVRTLMFPAALIALWTLAAAPLAAQALTSGMYTSPTEASTITVEATAEALTVVEPNWTSVYASAGGGEYRYTSTRGNVYVIRVLGPTEFESYRLGQNEPGSRFRLNEAPTLSEAPSDEYDAVAEKYLGLSQTDPDNVHLWAACGAMAMGRSMYDEAGFAVYARQTIALVKQIMVSPGTNPCPDAVPDAVWTSVH